MITNERQFKITRNQVERLRTVLREFNEIELARQGVDPVIITAQRDSLAERLAELEKQISIYEGLSSGSVKRFFPSSVADIGQKLIEARIAQGLSQKTLGERLGMKEQQIQRYEQERYLTANLTRVAEVLEALQLRFVASLETDEQTHLHKIVPNVSRLMGFDLARLPISEMKKRGWFAHLQLPDGAEALGDEDLAAVFMSQAPEACSTPSLNKQHVRAGSKQDPYALLAWKTRVLHNARKDASSFQLGQQPLDIHAVRQLASLSAEPTGPVHAIESLRQCGVILVFEPHLSSTHLDGAAMLLNDATPVIGLTLRHDRLDNFWFVLMHEVGHIVLHRERGLKEAFFDEEEIAATDEVEKEADEFAKRAFIADELWKRSFVRFTADSRQVQHFASERGIGAAVAAGRIRRERNDYTIFNDLIGYKSVRKLMLDAGILES
jgi:HTH-type transcriptional regulator / antitoxin HigA